MGAAKARAAILVGRAGRLVGANVKGVVRVGSYIRTVAQGRRALVTGADHAGKLLPCRVAMPSMARCRRRSLTRQFPSCRGPAGPAVIKSVPPTETTFASSAGQGPHLLDDHVELSPDAAKKKKVPLRCHLFEVRVKRGCIRRRPAPRAANAGGQRAMGSHGAHDGRIRRADVHHQARQRRRPCRSPASYQASGSVSSQESPEAESTQDVLVPSVDRSVIGTLLVWPIVRKVRGQISQVECLHTRTVRGFGRRLMSAVPP